VLHVYVDRDCMNQSQQQSEDQSGTRDFAAPMLPAACLQGSTPDAAVAIASPLPCSPGILAALTTRSRRAH